MSWTEDRREDSEEALNATGRKGRNGKTQGKDDERKREKKSLESRRLNCDAAQQSLKRRWRMRKRGKKRKKEERTRWSEDRDEESSLTTGGKNGLTGLNWFLTLHTAARESSASGWAAGDGESSTLVLGGHGSSCGFGADKCRFASGSLQVSFGYMARRGSACSLDSLSQFAPDPTGKPLSGYADWR
jgi:hypothetical protein